MADSAAIFSKGATISLATTQNGSYTAIGEVVNCEPGKLKVPPAQATHLLSVAAERKPALADAQPFKLTINYVGSQYATLLGYVGTMIWMKITLPKTGSQATVGDVVQYEGWFSENPLPVDKLDPTDTKTMQATWEFTPTGLPTFTAGS